MTNNKLNLSSLQPSPEILPENILRLEYATEHLVLRVISKDRNTRLRERYPHRDFLNLSVFLQWKINADSEELYIGQNILDRWNRTFDEMYEIALKNTMRIYPEQLTPLGQKINALCSSMDVDSPFLYVGTTEIRYGSVVMAYPGIFRRIYEQLGESYYLIPSSIHELLALPVSFDTDQQKIKDLVWEINNHVLPKSDVLSDAAYVYIPESDTLDLIA